MTEAPNPMTNREHDTRLLGELQGSSRESSHAAGGALDGAALLPCPFCGSAVRQHTYETESLWSHDIVPFLDLSCRECDCAHVSGEVFDDVRAAWNRRAPSSAEPALGDKPLITQAQPSQTRESGEGKGEGR